MKQYFEQYINWLTTRFGDEPNLHYLIRELTMAFHSLPMNSQIVQTEHGSGLILSPGDSGIQFGFVMHSENDLDNLWSKTLEEVKKMNGDKLFGPIQGSTYFPYRFITESDDSPFFKGEYHSKADEHEWMMRQKPAKVVHYRSAYRTTFQGIMKVSKPYYDQLIQKGLSYKVHDEITRNDLRVAFDIVIEVFGSNWAFQELSPEQFEGLYQYETANPSRLSLITIYWDDKPIGFVRFIEENQDRTICKTMAISREYQKMGIGNATVYFMHQAALDRDYNSMIYALVADDNRVKNMPQHDAVMFRSYASYEFDLR